MDIVVAAFAPDGAARWAMSAGSVMEDRANAVVAGAAGSLYVGGSTMESANFGEQSMTGAGYTDGFAVGLNAQTGWDCLLPIAAEQWEQVLDLGARGHELFVTGTFGPAAIELGGLPLSSAARTSFVWKLSSAQP